LRARTDFLNCGRALTVIIIHVFRKYWAKGTKEFEFHRDELVEAAQAFRIERPDNLGDVIYSFKFRRATYRKRSQTAPNGKAWMIEGAGRSRYRFRLVELGGITIKPHQDITAIKSSGLNTSDHCRLCPRGRTGSIGAGTLQPPQVIRSYCSYSTRGPRESALFLS
jgi:hypothetical protein